MRLCEVPVAPIVIGLVLGPIFEETLRQGLIITDGSFTAFFTLSNPIALGLLCITVLVVVFAVWTELRAQQRATQTDVE